MASIAARRVCSWMSTVPFHRPIPDSPQSGKKSNIIDAVVQAEKMIQIAFVLPCATFIGWLIGVWLDRELHQSWIFVAGLILGGASGLIYAIKLALMAEKQVAGGGDNGNKQS